MDRRPFLLNPNKPAEGEPRQQRDGETETELNPGMMERAKGVGLLMRRPTWSPDTKRVHEATIYAKEQGRDDEFHHAAAKGYWEKGINLGDTGVLKEVAQESGLNWDELGPRLESGQYRQQVLDEFAAAKEKGVGGTPTYMIAGEILGGDISVEDLRAAIKKAGQG